MTVDIELFDQVALFEGLDQDALQKVAETSKLITIPDATYFINENEDILSKNNGHIFSLTYQLKIGIRTIVRRLS